MYNYLFFKSVQLSQKLRDWKDTPHLFAIMVILFCGILHITTLLIILQIAGLTIEVPSIKPFSYFLSVIMVIGLALYYMLNDRGKKIVDKYEKKEALLGKSTDPIYVVCLYCLISIALVLSIAIYHFGWR